MLLAPAPAALLLAAAALWLLLFLLLWRRHRRGDPPLHRDALAIGLYVLLTIGFYWQVLLTPRVWVPAGGGDLAHQHFPMFRFASEQLKQGVFPFWNPYLYSGIPFYADVQTGLLYPPNLLAFLLAPSFTYETAEALVIAHYFLAASFAYACGRGLGQTRPGAFAAGVGFAFSGFLVAHLGHANMVAVATWFPLVYLFFRRFQRSRAFGDGALAAVAFALGYFAGHTQISLYTALVLAGLALFEALWPARPGSLRQRAATLLLPPALVLGLAALLVAAQALPSLDLVQASTRAAISYSRSQEYAFAPLRLVLLVVPSFFGENPERNWGFLANRESITESYGYFGLVALTLAALAVAVRRRQREVVLLALLGAVALLLAFAGATVLHAWLYRFAPGADKVRAVGRWLFLVDFAAAMLAGFGVDLLCQRADRRVRLLAGRVLAGLAALGALLALAALALYGALLGSGDAASEPFRRAAGALNGVIFALLLVLLSAGLLVVLRRRAGGPGLAQVAIALVVFDLFSANAGYNPDSRDPTAGFQHSQVAAFIQAEDPWGRINVVEDAYDVWQPATAMAYGLFDIWGQFNPLLPTIYDRYWRDLPGRQTVPFDVLGVKYVIGHKDLQLDWEKFEPALTDAPRVNVYRNRRALPRFLVVPRAEFVPDAAAAAAVVRRPGFDPRQTVVLVGEPLASGEGGDATGRVEALRYGLNDLALRVEASAPAWLYLAESYDPGWRAMVDGQPARVWQANSLFRAVAVPAGTHLVVMEYRPRFLELGAALSLATWLLLLARAVTRVRKGRVL